MTSILERMEYIDTRLQWVIDIFTTKQYIDLSNQDYLHYFLTFENVKKNTINNLVHNFYVNKVIN